MSNGSAVGDGPETKWTWKPAMQDRRSQPKVIVGAMIVLAVSCAVAGFVAGRLSGHTSHVGRDVAVASQPAAAPPVSVPRDGELGVSTPSSPAVAVKILNPGTADVGQQEESARATPRNDGRTLGAPSTDPGRTGGSKAGASAERDYRALRDYMLSR